MMSGRKNLLLAVCSLCTFVLGACAPSSPADTTVEAGQAASASESSEPLPAELPVASHAKEAESLITASWAKEPYRPDIYEGANHPDPHRAAFGLAFKNNSEKPIAAFKGTLRFLSVFGEPILEIPGFEQDKTIPAGGATVWTGSVQTLGNPAAEKLYSAEHSKVGIVIVPELVIFSDGSRWTLELGHQPPAGGS